jgi:hypothetical protein
MSRRTSFLAAGALLAVLAGLPLLAQGIGVPDGQPDISGVWTGKIKYRGWDVSGTRDLRGRGRDPIEATVSLAGGDLACDLIVRPDEDRELWTLRGVHGHGNFWAQGDHSPVKGPMTIYGHVRKNGKRLKGKGIVRLDEDAAIAEVTFTLKRASP